MDEVVKSDDKTKPEIGLSTGSTKSTNVSELSNRKD